MNHTKAPGGDSLSPTLLETLAPSPPPSPPPERATRQSPCGGGGALLGRRGVTCFRGAPWRRRPDLVRAAHPGGGGGLHGGARAGGGSLRALAAGGGGCLAMRVAVLRRLGGMEAAPSLLRLASLGAAAGWSTPVAWPGIRWCVSVSSGCSPVLVLDLGGEAPIQSGLTTAVPAGVVTLSKVSSL